MPCFLQRGPEMLCSGTQIESIGGNVLASASREQVSCIARRSRQPSAQHACGGSVFWMACRTLMWQAQTIVLPASH